MTIREWFARVIGMERRTLDDVSGAGFIAAARSSGSWTAAGVTVTPTKAMQSTAVLACARVLSESVASLPLILYRRERDGGKTRANDHPLYMLLHDLPNPEMTSYDLRRMLMMQVALWGNGYAQIVFGSDGNAKALWPLASSRVEIVRAPDGELWYTYRPDNGEAVSLPESEILHIRFASVDGVTGLSPVSLARQAVGLSLALESHGAAFFGNGARPGVVLQHPGKLSDGAYKRLKESWETRHQGPDNASRLAILEEGMQMETISVPPNDAQFLETRKFQVSDIARLYRVPPHMVGDLDRATFSNIEQQSLEFVTYTLRPWLVCWEQAISRTMLTPSERKVLFAEHLVDGLLRGDTASRYAAYAVARQNGWMSANDIRGLENMNPVEGGDVYLVPLNMIPANQVGSMGSPDASTEPGPAPEGEPEPEEERGLETRGWVKGPQEERTLRSATSRHRLVRTYRRLYRDTAARILRRERNDVLRGARKQLRSIGTFYAWLDSFYQEHGDFIYRQMLPVAQAYGEMVASEAQHEVSLQAGWGDELERFVRAYLASYAARHAGISKDRIKTVIARAQSEGGDLEEALTEEMDGWLDVRANRIADDETVRYNNALAKTVYVLAGISSLRWITFGENCPYCDHLDGMTIPITGWFLPSNHDYQPEGADRPLNPNHNVGHAPAHEGCDCMIGAA